MRGPTLGWEIKRLKLMGVCIQNRAEIVVFLFKEKNHLSPLPTLRLSRFSLV